MSCFNISHTDINLPSVSAYEGGTGSFACITPAGGVSSVEWFVNGSSLVEGDRITTSSVLDIGRGLTFQAVPLDYNGTTVQCRLNFSQSDRPPVQSNTATLLVQGMKWELATYYVAVGYIL